MPKHAPLEIPDTQEETEEFHLRCCELIPEQRLRHEVSLLKPHGYDLKTLNDFRAIFRLACIFDVSASLVLIRLLQVYPELKKRLAI